MQFHSLENTAVPRVTKPRVTTVHQNTASATPRVTEPRVTSVHETTRPLPRRW